MSRFDLRFGKLVLGFVKDLGVDGMVGKLRAHNLGCTCWNIR